MAAVIIEDVARVLGLKEEEVMQDALRSLLSEKKRQILQTRLEIMARYDAASLEDLEAKIASGESPEHPAWEDQIVIENLTAHLSEVNGYLNRLRGTD